MEKIQEQQRYYFPCANDDAKPTCFICRQFFRSIKSLFDHLNAHSDSDWGDVLPPQPTAAVVKVRRTLLPNVTGSPSSGDQYYSSLTENGLGLDEENNCMLVWGR